MMDITFHIAKTEEERAQIYRLRYEVYVEEMHIFGRVADHERRILSGPDDAHARLLYAKYGDTMIASMRINLGKDAPFSAELEQTYNLSRFYSGLDKSQMLVLTRFMVKKEFRGSQLAFRMIEQVARICVEEDIELAVCDCQPHLVRYYQRMGFCSYACEVYNDPEFGIMIPLAFVIRDLKYLDNIRSPLRKVLCQPVNDLSRVSSLKSLLGQPAIHAVDDMLLSEKDLILDKLGSDESSLFKGVSREEISSIIARGYVLSLQKDDLMIRCGQLTTTVFMVMAGELNIHRSGQKLRQAVAGEVIGELGFLLEARRSANVSVASEYAVVLALDESRLRKRLKARSASAAQLLYNLVYILASRVGSRADANAFKHAHSLMIAA